MWAGRCKLVAVGAILAAGAALWAIVGSVWILPQLSANSDEGLYLLQADALASGRLAPDAPEIDPRAHLPWFAIERDGRYVLKYAPVHASVLAASQVTVGSPRAALGAIAAAQVLVVMALTRELGASRRATAVAGLLFGSAPLALQLDITYLSYGTSLVLLLGAATGAHRAQRTGARPAAVAAGLCWGLAAFARPYDAVLVGVALSGALLVRRRSPGWVRRLRPLVAPLAAGAALPLAGLLLWNHAMTGDVLRLPFQLLDSHDAPGFGLRRVLPSDQFVDYTPARGLASLLRNLLLVAVWGAGGVLGVGLAGVTLLRHRLPGAGVVAALLVTWPVGYALFWGSYSAAFLWDGAFFLGPFYYLPMVAVLAVAAAVTLDDLWRWRPGVAAVAGMGVVVLSAGVAVPRLVEQHDRSQPRDAVADAVAGAVDGAVDGPTLIFVPPVYGPHLQNPLSFLRNRATLDGPVLYALDRDEARNRGVMAAHPDRRAFRLVLPNGWNDRPGFEPDPELEPLGDEPARGEGSGWAARGRAGSLPP